jgi:glutamate racemase
VSAAGENPQASKAPAGIAEIASSHDCPTTRNHGARREPLGRPRIAVFDSGFGGLTVLRSIVALVPNASYLYFGDSARLPYGNKSRETVVRYTVEAARFLEKCGAQILVIGCNTASSLALYDVKSAVEIPVIGVIEPGADHAAELSRHREAIVIATENTVASHAYQRALARRGFATYEKACPLLVPLVEEGWTDHPVTEQIARIYVIEALRGAPPNSDVMVLGCTHYPLLRPLLRRVVPQRIEFVDPADSTAQVVASLVSGSDPGCPNGEPTFRFFTTDSVEKFKRMVPLFLGRAVECAERVELETKG